MNKYEKLSKMSVCVLYRLNRTKPENIYNMDFGSSVCYNSGKLVYMGAPEVIKITLDKVRTIKVEQSVIDQVRSLEEFWILFLLYEIYQNVL